MIGQVLYCMPVIPVLRRLKQENHKFESSLGGRVGGKGRKGIKFNKE
jgi:hypothetical protein